MTYPGFCPESPIFSLAPAFYFRALPRLGQASLQSSRLVLPCPVLPCFPGVTHPKLVMMPWVYRPPSLLVWLLPSIEHKAFQVWSGRSAGEQLFHIENETAVLDGWRAAQRERRLTTATMTTRSWSTRKNGKLGTPLGYPQGTGSQALSRCARLCSSCWRGR